MDGWESLTSLLNDLYIVKQESLEYYQRELRKYSEII